MRPVRVLVVATLVASAVGAAPSWAARPPKPVTAAAVRACVAQNLVRYSDPQHAAVLQYVDIAAACRAALAGGGSDVQVQIVPIGSRALGIAKTALGTPVAAAGAVSSPSTAEPKAVTRPHRSKVGARTRRLRQPPEVAGLLPDGPSPRAPAPGLIDSAPWWALALVGAIFFGTARTRARGSTPTATVARTVPAMRRVAAVWAPADVGAAALCALPIAAAGVLAFHSGGYLIASWGIAAVVLLAALAVAALACERDWGGGPGTVALTGWAGLAAWQGLSSMWADEPAAATRAMGLTALYGAAFSLPLIALRCVSWLAWIGDAVFGVCAIVAGFAVCARLLPGVIGGDDGGRLSTPITYWNALGLLLAFGAVLALSRAGDPERTLPVRAAAAAAGPLFLLGLLLTLSRGATLALAVGLVVLLWLAPSRLETLAAAAVIGGISAPLIVAANARADLTSFGVLPPHAADGHHIALMLALAMAVAAIAAPAVVAAVRTMGKPQRRGVGWALALLAVAGVATAIAVGPPHGHPAAWAQRELDSFRTSIPARVRRRVRSPDGSRWQPDRGAGSSGR